MERFANGHRQMLNELLEAVGAEPGDGNVRFLNGVGISGDALAGAAARSWMNQGSLAGRNDVRGRRRPWGQAGLSPRR